MNTARKEMWHFCHTAFSEFSQRPESKRNLKHGESQNENRFPIFHYAPLSRNTIRVRK